MSSYLNPAIEVDIKPIIDAMNPGRSAANHTSQSLRQRLLDNGLTLVDGVELTFDYLNTGHKMRRPEGELGAFEIDTTLLIGYAHLEPTLHGLDLLPVATEVLAFYLIDIWDRPIHEVLLVPALDGRADEARFLSKHQRVVRQLSKAEYDRQSRSVQKVLDAAVKLGSSSTTGGFCVEASALPQLHATTLDFLGKTIQHYNYDGRPSRQMAIERIYGSTIQIWRRRLLGLP